MTVMPLVITQYHNGDLLIRARSDGATVYLTHEMTDLLMAMQSLPEPFARDRLPQFMRRLLDVAQIRMAERGSADIRASQQRGQS